MYYNDLGTLSFAQDESGAWGYKVGGADTVTPFKSGGDFIVLWGYTSPSTTIRLIVDGNKYSMTPIRFTGYVEYCFLTTVIDVTNLTKVTFKAKYTYNSDVTNTPRLLIGLTKKSHGAVPTDTDGRDGTYYESSSSTKDVGVLSRTEKEFTFDLTSYSGIYFFFIENFGKLGGEAISIDIYDINFS